MKTRMLCVDAFWGILLAAALGVWGVHAQPAPAAETTALASANADFGFKLLQQVVKEQPGKNVFLSPYGVCSVLQMAYNGAQGQTRTEMARVLGLTNLPTAAFNAAARACDQSLNGQGTNLILTTANAIWIRKGFSLKPEFVAVNQQFFGATADVLDFNDPATVKIMNGWAREKTHGRIPEILGGPIDPLTMMYLANAVYFKGKWEEPFDVKATKERVFHLAQGHEKKLPMMEMSKKFTYRRGSGYQAVRLPYMGWNLAMYVFLPDAGSSPAKLVSILNGDKWRRVTRPGFSETPGRVVLPRFRLDYGVELKKILMTLGMRSAFGPADFSGIADGAGLFISAVLQKTFVEVNEEGTEAAAVTMASAVASAPEPKPPKPFEMIVDRPFMFLIEDAQTQTILFLGVVYEPKTGEATSAKR